MAKLEMRRRTTLIGAMMVQKGDADGMICGTFGTTNRHLHYIDQVIGKRAGRQRLRRDERADAAGPPDVPGRHARQRRPDRRAAGRDHDHGGRGNEALRHRAEGGLLSHSNFGSSEQRVGAEDARRRWRCCASRRPDLEVDGEMHGDVALDTASAHKLMPDSTLTGDANLLVMPNIDAANISYNLLKTAAGNDIAIGPMLLGAPSRCTS